MTKLTLDIDALKDEVNQEQQLEVRSVVKLILHNIYCAKRDRRKWIKARTIQNEQLDKLQDKLFAIIKERGDDITVEDLNVVKLEVSELTKTKLRDVPNQCGYEYD